MRGTLLACGLLVFPVTAAAQSRGVEGLSGAAKLTAVLEEVSATQARLKTLTARFEQRKESRLLAEPSVSRGRFYFEVPDKVRWEYETPRQMTVVAAGGVALTYRPAERRAERIEVGRMQRKVVGFLTVSEPLDQLTRYFSVTLRDPGKPANFVILLQPTSYQVKKRIANVTVEIDRARFVPVAVSYVEADGDKTAYSFSEIVLDGPVPEAAFSLDLPEGVKVVEIKLRGGD